MLIIAVDDERIALEGLIGSIKEADPAADVHGFRYTEDALAFAQNAHPDVAFLDIETIDGSGIQLAHELKALNPDVNIIFATGHSQYHGDAFALHASGYLLKPITAEKVAQELSELRRPPAKTHHLTLKTFGNFEALADGVPLEFSYSKSKEMLAYLTDRKGSLCTMAEIAVALFEDDADHTSYLKRLRSDLVNTLERAGCENVIMRQRKCLGVSTESVNCDYFDWCFGDQSKKPVFTGEYMSQYSWAESTRAVLQTKEDLFGF